MEINIIANRNCIINFVNDFLTSNHLIFLIVVITRIKALFGEMFSI